jgi:hypothetical protein
MVMCFLYNIIFILANFTELIIVFRYKDAIEDMMWESRHSYYLDLYEHYEKYGVYYKLDKDYKS